MTYQVLRFLHPDKITICRPNLRDDGGRVVNWHCLRVVDSIDAARAALDRLELDGVADAVAISTTEQIVIEGDLAAKYFKIFFGMR